jgi:hypothetical protein
MAEEAIRAIPAKLILKKDIIENKEKIKKDRAKEILKEKIDNELFEYVIYEGSLKWTASKGKECFKEIVKTLYNRTSFDYRRKIPVYLKLQPVMVSSIKNNKKKVADYDLTMKKHFEKELKEEELFQIAFMCIYSEYKPNSWNDEFRKSFLPMIDKMGINIEKLEQIIKESMKNPVKEKRCKVYKNENKKEKK